MRRSLVAVGAVAALATGCGDPAGTPAATTEAASSTPADPGGSEACRLVDQAVKDGTLMSPGTVNEIIRESTRSGRPELAAAVRSLADAYAVALAAASKDEARTVDAVTSAAEKMREACTRAGLGAVR